MTVRIPVGLQNQLVLVLEVLDSPPQIAWLEPRLEHQCGVRLWGWNIIRQHIHCIVLGVQILSWRRVVVYVIVYYLFHQRRHHTDDLDVSFNGLFQHEGLRLVHRVLVLLIIFELRVLRQKCILDSSKIIQYGLRFHCDVRFLFWVSVESLVYAEPFLLGFALHLFLFQILCGNFGFLLLHLHVLHFFSQPTNLLRRLRFKIKTLLILLLAFIHLYLLFLSCLIFLVIIVFCRLHTFKLNLYIYYATHIIIDFSLIGLYLNLEFILKFI